MTTRTYEVGAEECAAGFTGRAPALLVALMLLLCASAAGQSLPSSPVLVRGASVRQELSGGAKHEFRLRLEAGQFVRAEIRQDGINVVVKLSPADGQGAVEIDSPCDINGVETVGLIPDVSGDYTLTVSSPELGVPKGGYVLTIAELRAATAEDRVYAEAVRAFAAGRQKRRAGDRQSLQDSPADFNKARELWQQAGDRAGVLRALNSLGLVYRALGQPAQSVESFLQASTLAREAGDAREHAYALNEAAFTHMRLEPDKAFELYNEALRIRRELGDRRGEASVLNNIGYLQMLTGRMPQAPAYLEKALSLWQAVGHLTMEANTRNNLAGVLDELGEPHRAIEYYREVARVSEQLGDKKLLAAAHNNIGKIHEEWGEADEALRRYDEALALAREHNVTQVKGSALHNKGNVYDGLGEKAKALENYGQALAIWEESNQPREQAIALTSIGRAYSLNGEHDKAVEYLNRALPLRAKAQDDRGHGVTLTYIGYTEFGKGDPRKAIESYNRALEKLVKAGDRRGQATALDKMGQAHAALGEYAQADDCFARALALWRALGDPNGEALTLYGVARGEHDRGRLSEAKQKVEEAIRIVESLRVRTSRAQLRTTYLTARQGYYELGVEIAMSLYLREGRDEFAAAALKVSERARARSLLDSLTEAQSDIIQTGDPALNAQLQQLRVQLSASAAKLLSSRNAKDARQAAATVEHLTRRVDELQDQYDELLTRIKIANPRYAALVRPEPLTLAEIQRMLPADTLLLEYALGEKNSYLWAVTRDGVRAYRLPARARIEAAARLVRDDLTARQHRPNETPEQYFTRVRKSEAEWPAHASQLSTLLFGEVAGQLKGGQRLVVVRDGLLQLIPFSALPVPTAPGAARRPSYLANEVVYLPSASTLAALRAQPRQPPAKTLAVIADPVFGPADGRTKLQAAAAGGGVVGARDSSPKLEEALSGVGASGGAGDLRRLASSGAEADAILGVAPAGQGMKAVGFDATRDLVLGGELAQYRVVHFATHGLLVGERPYLSGLVLSLIGPDGRQRDGYLRLYDIYGMRLRADLVVLSACDTGIGQEVRGEGLISLTRGFMYAGSPRVVASLWKVDDQATAELMKKFYGFMFKAGLPPAAALRRAQEEIRREQRWHSPYYWAGFVLQGDWQ